MLKIRNMTIYDIDKIVEIEKEIFKSPWSYDSFVNILNNEYTHYFTVAISDMIIGYFGLLIILDECQIYNIGIVKNERNNGYGNEIMNFIINFCIKTKVEYITLEVREYNFKAIHLYDKFGFKKISRIKDYYTNPSEDGLLMRLDLGDNIERSKNTCNRNIM